MAKKHARTNSATTAKFSDVKEYAVYLADYFSDALQLHYGTPLTKTDKRAFAVFYTKLVKLSGDQVSTTYIRGLILDTLQEVNKPFSQQLYNLLMTYAKVVPPMYHERNPH